MKNSLKLVVIAVFGIVGRGVTEGLRCFALCLSCGVLARGRSLLRDVIHAVAWDGQIVPFCGQVADLREAPKGAN